MCQRAGTRRTTSEQQAPPAPRQAVRSKPTPWGSRRSNLGRAHSRIPVLIVYTACPSRVTRNFASAGSTRVARDRRRTRGCLGYSSSTLRGRRPRPQTARGRGTCRSSARPACRESTAQSGWTGHGLCSKQIAAVRTHLQLNHSCALSTSEAQATGMGGHGSLSNVNTARCSQVRRAAWAW